jgi:hypothetical protein
MICLIEMVKFSHKVVNRKYNQTHRIPSGRARISKTACFVYATAERSSGAQARICIVATGLSHQPIYG